MKSKTKKPTKAVKSSGLSVTDGFGVWKPIATAPRGQTVLLYVANAFGHKHVKTGIAYPTNHPDLEIVSIFDDGEALGYKSEDHVTHWMPLPASPNKAI